MATSLDELGPLIDAELLRVADPRRRAALAAAQASPTPAGPSTPVESGVEFRNLPANPTVFAFRELARKFHPDVNPEDPEAGLKFREINEAYAALSDPEERARYDRWGHRPTGSEPTGFGAMAQAVEGAQFESLRHMSSVLPNTSFTERARARGNDACRERIRRGDDAADNGANTQTAGRYPLCRARTFRPGV